MAHFFGRNEPFGNPRLVRSRMRQTRMSDDTPLRGAPRRALAARNGGHQLGHDPDGGHEEEGREKEEGANERPCARAAQVPAQVREVGGPSDPVHRQSVGHSSCATATRVLAVLLRFFRAHPCFWTMSNSSLTLLQRWFLSCSGSVWAAMVQFTPAPSVLQTGPNKGSFCYSGGSCSTWRAEMASLRPVTVCRPPRGTLLMMRAVCWYNSHPLHRYMRAHPCGLDYEFSLSVSHAVMVSLMSWQRTALPYCD